MRNSGHAAAEYDAFISYSHEVDGRLAPAFQTGLHSPTSRMAAGLRAAEMMGA